MKLRQWYSGTVAASSQIYNPPFYYERPDPYAPQGALQQMDRRQAYHTVSYPPEHRPRSHNAFRTGRQDVNDDRQMLPGPPRYP